MREILIEKKIMLKANHKLTNRLTNYWKKRYDNDILVRRRIDRFLSKIKIDNECWYWMASKVGQGYGACSFYRDSRAHRVSFRLFRGKIPKSLCVCHSCDNPSCVNPKHLWLGTTQENTEDRYKKGRSASGDRNGTHTHPEKVARGDKTGVRKHPESRPRGDSHWARKHRELFFGENNVGAKLTEDKVRKIRKMFDNDKYTKKELSVKYNVSLVTIDRIVSRITWKHI